jgi:hypothetical protein
MKRPRTTMALAVALLAGCSGSKPTPPGPGRDAARGTGSGPGGAGGSAGAGSGGRADAAAPTGTGGGGGAAGEVDAVVGGMADAVAGGIDGGGGAGAVDAAAADLRPTRDARPLPDGPYRYPDPAGMLCGDTRHTLAKTPAQVMLVLDRSSSMDEEIGLFPTRTKWDEATAAVKAALAANPQIAWGLKLFPSVAPEDDNIDHGCDVTPQLEAPAGFGSLAGIAGALDQSPPPLGGGTPTKRAIEVTLSKFKASTISLPRYIVLVTDGVPNCDGDVEGVARDNAVKAIEAAAAAGIPTFVLGIVDVGDADAIATLDRMAVAGGEPRGGMPRHYSANNRAQLDAALAAITNAITNCVFPLAVPPLDPGFVGVTVDGQLIARDPTHAEGWDYSIKGLGVEIFGSACTDLKNGAALSVGVHYGCPK